MHKEHVQKFYEILWDAHDKDAIPSVLHENFTFADEKKWKEALN
jgi:hypothetical protein